MNILANKLKKTFFGIDDVIDDVCEYIEPWVSMPDCYNRPLIVNLWGMTGTGKTTLVRKIAKELKIPIIQIDVGSFVGESKDDFVESFFNNYFDYAKKPCIILLDEIHNVNTISEEQKQIDREKIRGMWSLLSDGLIVVDQRGNHKEYFYDYCPETFFDGIIYKYKSDLNLIKKSKVKNIDIEYIEKAQLNLNHPGSYFGYSGSFIKSISQIVEIDLKDLNIMLKKDFFNTINMLRKKIIKLDKNIQPVLDFRKSVIFVCGNLDGLYTSSSDFDPDIDLDNLYRLSKDISIYDVKSCLSNYFKPEQIGRLGNNHIIYPSLKTDSYYKIIRNELKRISNFFRKKEIPVSFSFDKSILDIILSEGLVPAQGARSVLTKINYLIEPNLIKYYINNLDSFKENKYVKVSFDIESKSIKYINGNNICKYKVELKSDDYRKPVFSERSANTAVHEAGHVVMCLIEGCIIPVKASAYKLTEANGDVQFYFNEEDYVKSVKNIKKFIRINIAGMCAEKLIFGEENVSIGSIHDLKNATSYIFDIINYEASGGNLDIIKCRGEDSRYGIRNISDNGKASAILQQLEKEVFLFMEENIEMLKEFSARLISNTFLTRKEIKNIAKKYNYVYNKDFSFKKAFLESFYIKDDNKFYIDNNLEFDEENLNTKLV